MVLYDFHGFYKHNMKTANFFDLHRLLSFYNLRFKRRQENLILKTVN